MGNAGGKPWDALLVAPEGFPVVHGEYLSDEPRCYHADQLLSFSALDFKIRDISGDPEIKYLKVADDGNDGTYTPMYYADTTDWENWTGQVSRLSTWHKEKEQRRSLYYLSETAVTKAYKVCHIMLEKKGEVLYTVVMRFFKMNPYFEIFEGKDDGEGKGSEYRCLYKLKANWKEDRMALTPATGDTDPIAVWWKDFVQMTESFRFKAAANVDHSMIMAIMLAAKLLHNGYATH